MLCGTPSYRSYLQVPDSNGGIFFHTEPQSGALKKGYEAQVCNTH
jgi:hypothetical protein